MKIKLYTRSMNPEYFGMMRQLIPEHLEHERCTTFNEWWHAKDYLHHCLQSDADFVINIDEDCFVYNWPHINTIIQEMKRGNYTHAGVPDRHLSHHRHNLYVVTNPFFNIFNMRLIRDFYTGLWQTTEAENIECYNAIFLELAFFGKPLFLNAINHEDGITTDTGFALHTWYSRDPAHRERIISRFDEAVHRSTLPKQASPLKHIYTSYSDSPPGLADINS